ncbi:hypothetical protein GF407_18495 [candidate division KSB1 bacterium]|nr:hypothetical protein [candidate division KSB1 bacterium]
MVKHSIIVILLLAAALQAQTFTEQSSAAQYILGREDQVLMAVNIWGFVAKPGQYMVPYDTDLISLLSYAGGPREEAKIKNIKLVRATTEEEKGEVFEIDVKSFIESGDTSIIPQLRPGDTVIVSGTSYHFFSKFFEFVWRIATIAQAYAFIVYWAGRD